MTALTTSQSLPGDAVLLALATRVMYQTIHPTPRLLAPVPCFAWLGSGREWRRLGVRSGSILPDPAMTTVQAFRACPDVTDQESESGPVKSVSSQCVTSAPASRSRGGGADQQADLAEVLIEGRPADTASRITLVTLRGSTWCRSGCG